MSRRFTILGLVALGAGAVLVAAALGGGGGSVDRVAVGTSQPPELSTADGHDEVVGVDDVDRVDDVADRLAEQASENPGSVVERDLDEGSEGTSGGDSLNPVLDASAFPIPQVNALDPDPLPVPERPPADPYAAVEVPEIGAISIPAIGLDHDVVEGITLTAINQGPGHWPGSALPGRRGNAVFPGHRTTYTHPFGDLDLLEVGDEIVFTMPDGVHTYAVTETLIVVPTDMWIVDQTEVPTVTLVACHPKGSAAQRIVVRGELVSSEPSVGAAAAALVLADLAETLPL